MKSNKLKVSLVQTDIVWESVKKNLEIFAKKIERCTKSDLIILPEMFTTGFSMQPKQLAESMDGETVTWMKSQAKKLKAVISGSIIIRDRTNYFNRFLAIHPSGQVNHYDKRHLFRMGDEQNNYTGGEESIIFTIDNWRIKPLICYDLRFPVWSRNRNDYDVLIYVANWPENRREVWKQLLVARAIENQSYVIGVNRIGSDGMGISYSGDSLVISPKGVILSIMEPGTDGVVSIELSMDELVSFREKFPAWMDGDEFKIM